MRSIFRALLAAALTMCILTGGVMAADTVFTVAPRDGPVKAGDAFTVAVDLSGNPGFNAIQLTLAFNADEMECSAVETGELLEDMLCATNPRADGGAVVAAASLTAAEGDGTLARFTFTAKRDLTRFDFTLTNVKLFDTEKALPFTVNGAAYVAAPEPSPTKPDSPAPPARDDGAEGGEKLTAPYADARGHWGEQWIARAAEQGFFQGYPDGSFRPDAPVTRGDLVLTLWRMAGKPAADGALPFSDVAGDAYYAQAIAWAYGAGYVNGRGDGFDPAAPVTRQEAAKILFACSGGQSGFETLLTPVYDTSFADSGEIADWAKSAMYWAYYNEIINGMDGGLNPAGQATRAQIAKILVQYTAKTSAVLEKGDNQ